MRYSMMPDDLRAQKTCSCSSDDLKLTGTNNSTQGSKRKRDMGHGEATIPSRGDGQSL